MHHLKDLGFGLVTGIPRRPLLLKHNDTMEALYRTALMATPMRESKNEKSLKVTPELGFTSKPVWTMPSLETSLFNQVGRPVRRLRKKTSPWSCLAALSVRTKNTRKRITVPIRVAVHGGQWTTREERELKGLQGHARHLQEKRLLHNRHASERGQHVLAEVLDAKGQMKDRITCSNCGLSVLRGQLAVWAVKSCTIKRGAGRLSVAHLIEHRKVIIDKCSAAGHAFAPPTADQTHLTCTKCSKQRTFRRWMEFLGPSMNPMQGILNWCSSLWFSSA